MAEDGGKAQAEANVAVVRRFYEEVYTQGRDEVLDEVIAPDYVDYGHQPPGHGPQGARDDYLGVRSFSDRRRFDLDDVVAAGDTVAVRWTGHLVHTGSFAGFEPTGNEVTLTGMSFYKLRDGQLTETRNQADVPGLLAQLEAPPAG